MKALGTNGWRWLDRPACAEPHPAGRWSCERERGHTGWHSCDNACWPPAKKEPRP